MEKTYLLIQSVTWYLNDKENNLKKNKKKNKKHSDICYKKSYLLMRLVFAQS